MANLDAYGNPAVPVSGATIAQTWGEAVRDRVVNQYPTSTARDLIETAPDNGRLIYQADVDELEVYDGSGWDELLRSRGIVTIDSSRLTVGASASGEKIRLARTAAGGMYVGFYDATEATREGWVGFGSSASDITIKNENDGAKIIFSARDASSTDRTRIDIDGDGHILVYGNDGAAIAQFKTGRQTYGYHPDSGSYHQTWPMGSLVDYGSQLAGAGVSIPTTEGSLFTTNLSVTADEPIVVMVFWSIRIGAVNGQVWARSYVGGAVADPSGSYPMMVDRSQSTDSGSHSHTHTATHDHFVDLSGGVNTSADAPGSTNSSSHSHTITSKPAVISGVGIRAFTPTGSTVAVAVYGIASTSGMTATGQLTAIAWRDSA